jgi:hypothetical protein
LLLLESILETPVLMERLLEILRPSEQTATAPADAKPVNRHSVK